MEETELEEGETCLYPDDSNIDPDIALSYIDEKLQNVLGHFQKDFEGGVSAENLGSKFGGYGSFLPTHRLSPRARSHANTPQGAANSCVEDAPSNSTVPGELAVDVKPVAATASQPPSPVQAVAASARKPEIGDTSVSQTGNPPGNFEKPTDQRSLKVRIKVGSDKTVKKNVAIYSGLGLISPSSSTDNDTEESDGTPTVSRDIPFESPGRILHDMTSAYVPGNLLVSPLSENLLCLSRKEKVLENNVNVPRKSSSLVEKKGEVREGTKRDNGTHSEGDVAPGSEKVKGKEYPESIPRLTNDSKVKQPSDPDVSKVSRATPEAQRCAKKDVPVKKREMKRDWVKDRHIGPDPTSKESESGGPYSGSYGPKDVKRYPKEGIEETKERGSAKKPSVDSRESSGVKVNRVPSVCKNTPDVSKHETDPMGRFEKKAVKHEQHEGKACHAGDTSSFEKKKDKSKGGHSGGISSSKSVVLGTIRDKNAQKDILKVRNSYDDILGMRDEFQSSRTKGLERPVSKEAKDPIKDTHGLTSGPSSEPPKTEVAPPVPRDNWVGCDRCEKWRLLPLGIEPDHLPDKWLCSMATWLPGRNRCDVVEEETTRVVQEMNLFSLLKSQNSLQPYGGGSISDLAHPNSNSGPGSGPDTLKKNPRPMSSMLTSHLATDAPPKHGLKRKSLSGGVSQPPLETNKSSSFAVEKYAAKSDGRDASGGDMKLKRPKTKTDSDERDYVTSNKVKTEAAPNADGFRKSEAVGDGGGSHRPRDRLVISVKRERDSTQVLMRNESLDRKTSDNVELHAKKRKLKDWQESQPNDKNRFVDSANRDKSGDKTERKEKRLKVSSTEVTENSASKGEDKSFRKGTTMRIILPSSSIDRSREKNQQQSKRDDFRSSRTDAGSERNVVAVTSSSSKVSDSCRRASLHEIRGSPVGSVSSSPRTAISRKGLAKGGGGGSDISRKLLAREARPVKEFRDPDVGQRSGGENESKVKQSYKIRETHVANHDVDPVTKQPPGQSHASGGRTSMKGDTMTPGDGFSSRPKDKDRSSGLQRVKVKVSEPAIERESFPSKPKRAEANTVHGGPASHPDGKHSHEARMKLGNNANSVAKKGLGPKRGVSDGPGDEKPPPSVEHGGPKSKSSDMGGSETRITVKGDLKVSKKSDSNDAEVGPREVVKVDGPVLVRQPLEASGLDAQRFNGPGHNVSKPSKHPGDAVDPNVNNPPPDRRPMKDLGVLSFVKEYVSSQTAASALKRAEESKDYADRLKVSGFNYECNEANFDAALKFLYAASLLEAGGSDGGKSKAMDQVHVYSTAAKLFKSCAQEYEKRKEMAVAALAYKCMEVAYMKIVYCKSYVTNRDRHDLQASLQLVAQGDSPSSSASDVDNLNNQAAIDKAVLSKSFAHVGNNVVVARNQAHFVRLLDFTSDAISAMEACRNMQKVYAAAHDTPEEAHNKDTALTVKRAVDFSFQDVKEFVCLVQNAREAINRQGLGNRD